VQAGAFDTARMGSPPFASPYSLHDLASNVVFAQALLSTLNPFLDQIKFIGGWNSPSWTISVEFWTSIIFAVACLTAPRRLVPLAFLGIIGTTLWLCTVGPASLGVGIDFGVSRALLGFCTGYLIYALYKTGKAPMRGAAAEFAALAAVVAIVWIAGDNWLSFIAVPIFALCVYVFAHESGPLSRALSTPAATKLGEWSFSIYLVHFVILEFVLAFAQVMTLWGYPMLGDGAGPGVFENSRPLLIGSGWITDLLALPYLALVLIVSSFTYRWIEEPARDWANAFSLRWAARQRARLDANAPVADKP
jgi:peptidoglycan/LPS O-acetylase OafA/YrhL